MKIPPERIAVLAFAYPLQTRLLDLEPGPSVAVVQLDTLHAAQSVPSIDRDLCKYRSYIASLITKLQQAGVRGIAVGIGFQRKTRCEQADQELLKAAQKACELIPVTFAYDLNQARNAIGSFLLPAATGNCEPGLAEGVNDDRIIPVRIRIAGKSFTSFPAVAAVQQTPQLRSRLARAAYFGRLSDTSRFLMTTAESVFDGDAPLNGRLAVIASASENITYAHHIRSLLTGQFFTPVPAPLQMAAGLLIGAAVFMRRSFGSQIRVCVIAAVSLLVVDTLCMITLRYHGDYPQLSIITMMLACLGALDKLAHNAGGANVD